MSRAAKHRGIAGLVVDGAVRDLAEIEELAFPVWAVSATPHKPFKRVGGAAGVPVRCGGVLVQPGDVVFGDHDGVVAIPQEEYEAVLNRAIQRRKREDEIRRRLSAGESLIELLYLLKQP